MVKVKNYLLVFFLSFYLAKNFKAVSLSEDVSDSMTDDLMPMLLLEKQNENMNSETVQEVESESVQEPVLIDASALLKKLLSKRVLLRQSTSILSTVSVEIKSGGLLQELNTKSVQDSESKSAEEVELPQVVESVQVIELNESVQPVEAVESVESVETVKNVEKVKNEQPIEVLQPVDVVKSEQPVDVVESVEVVETELPVTLEAEVVQEVEPEVVETQELVQELEPKFVQSPDVNYVLGPKPKFAQAPESGLIFVPKRKPLFLRASQPGLVRIKKRSWPSLSNNFYILDSSKKDKSKVKVEEKVEKTMDMMNKSGCESCQ